ncbi:hypothetical protein RHMOL_Rhmol12G0001700 [Rhododendron molle]|uniref:Uncharacterized protein n=1 Tax=Rhododendron molle TaxID=49168 RepID=A0ACC0LD94_RHOML|nr:hypothetical protein RHMOL_Rhmol12G0001700 [Rhododendron molle]
MASFLRKVRCVSKTLGGSGSSSDSAAFRALFLMPTSSSRYSRSYAAKAASSKQARAVANEVEVVVPAEEDDDVVPTSGISRPLSEILKQLNKKVPDSLIRPQGTLRFTATSIFARHLVNRILNLHAPEWSGEVRSISYSADGKSVSVVYRVTLYGTDAEIYRESTGTASVNEGTRYGDPVQKAEAMAFRRACARLGLGLHLYHEDML